MKRPSYSIIKQLEFSEQRENIFVIFKLKFQKDFKHRMLENNDRN